MFSCRYVSMVLKKFVLQTQVVKSLERQADREDPRKDAVNLHYGNDQHLYRN